MMRNHLAVLLTVGSLPLLAQTTEKKVYLSGGGEMALSTSILDVNGNSSGAIIRFAPVLNMQQTVNRDMSEHFGLFIGLSLCNSGFIYDPDTLGTRYKFRTYNLGLPLGFKVGTMNKGLLFAGYSPEWAFQYKEKVFKDEDKADKSSIWWSDRPTRFAQAVFLGFQFANGSTIKVKYYVTNFHNKDFHESSVTNTPTGSVAEDSYPYKNLNANVLSVSFGFALFKDQALLY